MKVKAEYEVACNVVKELLDERDAHRQKLLMSALAKNDKIFDDVLKFIESNNSED